MPEGPEVSFMVNRLNELLAGKYLQSIILEPTGRYGKKSPDNFSTLIARLPLKIITVANKGKFIYFQLEGDIIIFQTLGMAGGWYNQTHRNLSFTINYSKTNSNTDASNSLFMVDPRHFATIKIFLENGKTELEKKLKTLGVDLVNYFSIVKQDEQVFITSYMKIMRKNNGKNICVVLMEQKNFSGIGNYLKSEILNDANIHPMCKVEQLTDDRLMDLYASMKKIIKASIKSNGTKITKYSDMIMPPEDAVYEFEVYQKTKDKNGIKILKLKTPDNRTTFVRENVPL